MNESQHIERVEQEQHSSAGWATQRLPDPGQMVVTQPSAGQPVPVAPGGRSRNNRAGLLLIAAGVLFWLTRTVGDQGAVTGGMVLLTIASPFLFFAFWRRIYPLLIPGCILAGLSIGVPFAELTNGISVLWGLALGFMAIYFLGRELFNVRIPWPIFPAVPLFAVGIIVAVASLPAFLGAGFMWLPLMLIAAGLFLGWGRHRP